MVPWSLRFFLRTWYGAAGVTMAVTQCFLWVVLLICVIGPTAEFELDERDWEDLGSDLASLHRLKGLAQHITHHPITAEGGDHRHEVHRWKEKIRDSGLARDTSLKCSDELMKMETFTHLQQCSDFAVCILHKQQDLNNFLKNIEGQKAHEALLFASEVSYTYRHKLILIMDNEPETIRKSEEEYSEDPHYSTKVHPTCLNSDSCSSVAGSDTVIKIIGKISQDGDTLSGFSGSSLSSLMLILSFHEASLFSITGNISRTFRNNFLSVFRSHDINAVLETTIQNDHVYQIVEDAGAAVVYQVPKRPVDHTTQYDTQHILIMEDDPIVRDAATFLYEKHPTVSSVYILENQRPKLIKGDPVPLSAESRLVLVGHGKKSSDGKMRLAGYEAEEVAMIITHMNIEENQIKTTSVVGCDVGSDETFRNTLLKELQARSIETELHLRNTLVQVFHSGEKITADIRTDGLFWTHRDESKKIIVKLDKNGEVLTQIQSGIRGQEMFSAERNVLGTHDFTDYRNIKKDLTSYKNDWPDINRPQTFVEHYEDEDIKIQLNNYEHITEIEGFCWVLFAKHDSKSVIDRLWVKPNVQKEKYLILDIEKLKNLRYQYKQFEKDHKNNKAPDMNVDISLKSESEMKAILKKCREIKSGNDLFNVIHHNAKYGDNYDTFMMINEWIFQVDSKNLYVYPVGKRLKQNEIMPSVQKCIKNHIGKEGYFKIRKNIKDRHGYAQYCKQTLEGSYTAGTYNMETESWFSVYFLGSWMSESSRNFRTLPLNLMALEMAQSSDNNVKENGIKFLLEELPMARQNTWISPNERGFRGSASDKGSSKLNNKLYTKTPDALKNDLKILLRNENHVATEFYKYKSILNHNQKIENIVFDGNLFSYLFTNNQPKDSNYFKQEFKKFSENYGSEQEQHPVRVLGGSHDGAVTLRDVHSAADVESSLKFSSHYYRSSTLLAEHVHTELQRTFGEKVQELHVKPDSVIIKDGEFKFELISVKNPHEITEWKMKLPSESQTQMEKIWKSMKKVSAKISTHKISEHMERTGTALGILGFMLGAHGAAQAFEHGNITQGIMGTLQSVHGFTGMALAAVGKKVSVSAGSKVMKTIATALKNPVTKRALVVLPLAGIGFSIYNIWEDSKRNDTLGKIDLALDSLILALDVVELVPVLTPFIAPINLAVNAIRMVFDDIYVDVQKELEKLPPDAKILDKIGAFFRGLGKGFVHFILDVESFFVTIPYREIDNGQELVEQISDYHKYYSTTEVQAGRKAIDFTGGQSSWNGGDITFCLSDQGPSEFCMDDFVSADESIGRHCWNIDTHETDDVILGTGESHSLVYSNIQIRILLLIPAGSVRVVSGYEEIQNSRYGHYSGNSKENNFYAVQTNPDKHIMEVMLSYYYQLYGKEGDDTFYLGPQRSYVEGQGGKDTYIIPKDGGNAIINNYDPQKTIDVLILSVNYHQISVTKTGNSVVLQYYGDHNVMMMDWFTGEQYQHINIISADGVLFGISPTVISTVKLVARGVNLMSKSEGQTVDTTDPLLNTVTNIMGSPHNDSLTGNAQTNMIDGGGGWDYMKGGEGEDVYVVNEKKDSKVMIENYSMDKKMDMVIIEANLHDFKTKVEGTSLILMPFSDIWSDVTLINWFSSEEDRHLLVVTKDLIIFSLSADMSLCNQPDPVHSKCILSQIIDYSKSPSPLVVDLETDEALQNVTEVRGSNLDDNIKGNGQGNTIIPGEGADFLQGRVGQDLYVVTPGLGLKTIDNYSPDFALDTLFLKVNYELIEIKCSGPDLTIFSSFYHIPYFKPVRRLKNHREEVHLKQWFISVKSQHLQVRTADGITFNLETNSSKCGDQLKLPQTVDYRTKTSDQMMLMNNREFVSVVEMYGSSGYDTMIGNDKDNLLDPYTGGGAMTGGQGKDTYTVKPEYGTHIVIDNFAEDGMEDTVLFQAEFLTNPLSVHADNHDVIISANEKGQDMKVRLKNYRAGQKHQHLSFQSADGVHFWVRSPMTNQSQVLHDPWIEAYKVILKDQQLDCHINLGLQRNLSTVYTVQGCTSQSNYIEGNDLDNALFGGSKHDIIDGGDGHDTLIGGQGNDIIRGSSGDDTLYGEDGDDTLMGGPGWDKFIPGPGADVMDGGSGRDTVLYQGDHGKGEGVYVNLLSGEGHQADAEGDVLKDVETVIGTIYSDILVSGYEPALLKGSDGDDVLVSVVDGDYLIGGEGRDIYMMVPHHGWITIDNCAEDGATDIVYLPSVSGSFPECSESSSGLSLKFDTGDGGFVGIFLKDWVNTTQHCGHLSFIMRGGLVSVETLQQNCKFNKVLKILETTVIIGLVVIVHIIGLVLLKKRRRSMKQIDGEPPGSTQQQRTDAAEERSEEEE
ncbi:uncharacterized protein LOC143517645 isoform X2 [Brachyhypopomus gauderio]|uniref:uncharacterized protein LOC143517645 isoform X2 n=1 Tax=Brachyhypopomus gauderio TaxID=698409 RepID=UPI004041000D